MSEHMDGLLLAARMLCPAIRAARRPTSPSRTAALATPTPPTRGSAALWMPYGKNALNVLCNKVAILQFSMLGARGAPTRRLHSS